MSVLFDSIDWRRVSLHFYERAIVIPRPYTHRIHIVEYRGQTISRNQTHIDSHRAGRAGPARRGAAWRGAARRQKWRECLRSPRPVVALRAASRGRSVGRSVVRRSAVVIGTAAPGILVLAARGFPGAVPPSNVYEGIVAVVSRHFASASSRLLPPLSLSPLPFSVPLSLFLMAFAVSRQL